MGYILYFPDGILDSETSKQTNREVKKERKMQPIKNKMKSLSSAAVKVFIVIYVLAITVLAYTDMIIPERITVTEAKINASGENVSELVTDNGFDVEAKLFGKLPLKTVRVDVIPDSMLIPCGNVFGVKFFTKGVIVIKLSDIETVNGSESPARIAGLETGDIICSIDGAEINTVEEMAECVEKSHGSPMKVEYLRNGSKMTTEMTPLLCLSDRKYKTGIWVRDSTAGIGTMTYYNPRTGEFAGLGHGICDTDTGLLMPLLEASVVDVEITDIIKGRKGSPGELKGDFDSVKRGELVKNTGRGVYGKIGNDSEIMKSQPMEIGLKDELKEGDAVILCQLDSEGVKEYKVKISKIRDDEAIKNFVIEVTDKRLIEKTGGIVQGMSGSPVIQNGKLVGAVTHVLVNSPLKGYGIFIENMLNDEDVKKD